MTITIEIKTLILPEEFEKLEDELRDFLNHKRIEAVIDNTEIGNTTVARGVPGLTVERRKELLDEWGVEQEKAWPMWVLTQGTIEEIAKQKGLSMVGKDPDEIARMTKKGIDAALDFVWEEAVEGGIRNTEANWEFSIIDRNLLESSEHRDGNSYRLTETWVGEIECRSGDASFMFDFELVHHVTEDNGGDAAKITSSKPDVFNEDEWDDLIYAMADFIETTYRAEHWKE